MVTACTSSDGQGDREAAASPAAPTRLPAVVLRADVGDRPARWRRVVTLPFGASAGRLGFVPVGIHTPVPYVPVSFAVGDDGSFWILDVVKRRVAHFDHAGRYLGSIHGLRFDRFHAHPSDVVIAAGRPVVLEQRPASLAAVIDVPTPGGGVSRTAVRSAQDALRLVSLVPSRDGVVGWVTGTSYAAPDTGSGYTPGYAHIDAPRSGLAHRLPGMPLGDGAYASLDEVAPGRFEARFTRNGRRSILPIDILLISDGRPVPAAFVTETATVLEHGFASFLHIGATTMRDTARAVDGRWLLALFDDGSPMLWERIREPAFDDELVSRHIAPGPGDSLYLMEVTRRGVEIFRR